MENTWIENVAAQATAKVQAQRSRVAALRHDDPHRRTEENILRVLETHAFLAEINFVFALRNFAGT
jgi:hypothetical protein